MTPYGEDFILMGYINIDDIYVLCNKEYNVNYKRIEDNYNTIISYNNKKITNHYFGIYPNNEPLVGLI